MARPRHVLKKLDLFIARYAIYCTGGVGLATYTNFYPDGVPSKLYYELCITSAIIALFQTMRQSRVSTPTQRDDCDRFIPWNLIVVPIVCASILHYERYYRPHGPKIPVVMSSSSLPAPSTHENVSASRFFQRFPSSEHQKSSTSLQRGHHKLTPTAPTADSTPAINSEVEMVSQGMDRIPNLPFDIPVWPIEAAPDVVSSDDEIGQAKEFQGSSCGSDSDRTAPIPIIREQILHPAGHPPLHTGFTTYYPAGDPDHDQLERPCEVTLDGVREDFHE
jgi:hypothetical protein